MVPYIHHGRADGAGASDPQWLGRLVVDRGCAHRVHGRVAVLAVTSSAARVCVAPASRLHIFMAWGALLRGALPRRSARTRRRAGGWQARAAPRPAVRAKGSEGTERRGEEGQRGAARSERASRREQLSHHMDRSHSSALRADAHSTRARARFAGVPCLLAPQARRLCRFLQRLLRGRGRHGHDDVGQRPLLLQSEGFRRGASFCACVNASAKISSAVAHE